MSNDMWRLLCEGIGTGIIVAGVAFGLFSDWLIVRKLRPVFVTHEELEQYKLLAAKDNAATTQVLGRLSDSIDELSKDQKALSVILAKIEGFLGAQVPNAKKVR